MRLIVVGDCVKVQHKTHLPASDANSNVDRKGIKRGACEEAGCTDCDSYFHDPQRGSQCQYCGCFPTKHRKIDESITDCDLQTETDGKKKTLPPQPPEVHIIDDGKGTMVYEVAEDGTITIPDDNDLGNSSEMQTEEQDDVSLSNFMLVNDAKKHLSLNTNKENTPQNQTTSGASFATLTSHLPREELYQFCVPTNVPVLPSLNSMGECVDVSNSFFLLRWISWSMFNLKLATEKDYTEVAKLTMQRYPALVSTLATKDLAGMVRALKELLHKHFFDRKHTKQPEPKTKPRPVHKSESIRISNSFSIANVVSSTKTANEESTTENLSPSKKSNFLKKPAPAPVSAPSTVSTPSPVAVPSSLPTPPVEHIPSKQFKNCKEHLLREMRKLKPSMPILQTFLSSIRKDRLIMAKYQSYSTQTMEFPCLENPDLVVWEFIQQEQLKCSLDDLKSNWLEALPQMVEYFLCGSKDEYEMDTKTSEIITMEILQTISTPAFFGPDPGIPKSEMRRSHVLEVFQDNILPLFVFPQSGDPPRLFSLGGVDEVYVYIDGQAVYNGPILDSLLFVVSMYHVFCLTPAPTAQASFAFVFGILMKDKGIEMYANHKFAYDALKAILKV